MQLFIKDLQGTEGSYFTSSAAGIVSTTSLVNQGSLNIRLGKDLWLVAYLVDSHVSFYQTEDESQDKRSLPWFKPRQEENHMAVQSLVVRRMGRKARKR